MTAPGLDARQFRAFVVRPTLHKLGLWSAAAENLLVGTALTESALRALVQDGGPGFAGPGYAGGFAEARGSAEASGPALGVYQIEPATHRDVLANFLEYRLGLAQRVRELRAREPDPDEQLVTNLAYATAVCRVIYYRRPEPLPEAQDIEGLGEYWKQHFNTPRGAGTVTRFVAAYREHGARSDS
jgi:hypothetical protein